jgi:hypothetical protein
MLDHQGLGLIIVAVVMGTATLLGAGLLVGYRFGLGTTAPLYLSPEFADLGRREKELDERLEQCRHFCSDVVEKNKALATLLDTHQHAVPVEIKLAIDRLVQATTLLHERMRETHLAAPLTNGERKKFPAFAQLPPSPPHDLPRREASPPPAESPEGLTAEEMNRLTSQAGQQATRADQQRRYSFEYHRYVFPCDADGEPDLARAQVARFHDISVQGTAFFWHEDPDFRQVQIALGSDDAPLFMLAEVIQAKSAFMHGEMQILVSCQFVQRCQPPAELLFCVTGP